MYAEESRYPERSRDLPSGTQPPPPPTESPLKEPPPGSFDSQVD